MAEAQVTWIQDFQFVGSDSTNHSVILSTPGEDSIGMKPSELLLVSLAGCTSVDVVNILHKKRVKLGGLRVKVSGEQAPLPPWTFEKFHIHYEVTGKDISEKDVERAITLSEEKYCSVSATLRAAAKITQDYEIIGPDKE
jgi:putative redox protein